MGKRSPIERFFGIAKRWFGLNDFHGKGIESFLLRTLLFYIVCCFGSCKNTQT